MDKVIVLLQECDQADRLQGIYTTQEEADKGMKLALECNEKYAKGTKRYHERFYFQTWTVDEGSDQV